MRTLATLRQDKDGTLVLRRLKPQNGSVSNHFEVWQEEVIATPVRLTTGLPDAPEGRTITLYSDSRHKLVEFPK